MSTIKQIRVGGSTYDIVATDSEKLGGQEASKYALVANLPTQYAPVDAEKNVQSNWNETNTSSDAYIKNKPTIPTKSSWNYDDAYVKYSASQSLTDTQKTQARTNIGAGTSSFSGNYDDLTNKPTIPTVNNGKLTIQVNGTSKGTFTANQSGNSTVNITAEALGLSGAMRFLGSTTTAIGDGFTTNPITIKVDGVDTSITPAAGNVVLYGGYEYVWTGSAWEQLGQEGSFSLRGHDHEVSVDEDTFLKAINGGSGSLTSDTTATNGIAYVASTSHTAASLGTASTLSAAPGGHTHNYDKATGVTLTANTATATGRITYLQDVSHTAASLTGTKTFNTDAIKSVTLSASETSTDGPQYIQDVTHTAASLTGTTTFNTDAIKAVSLSESTTTTDGPAYISAASHTAASLGTPSTGSAAPSGHKHSVTAAGTVSLGSNTTASGGVPYIAEASYNSTSKVLTITTKYFHPSFTGTAVDSGTNTGTAITAVTGYPNFSGGSASHTTRYMKVSTTAASTGTVGISGGSISKTTRYMKTTGTAASTGTVGISGGSVSKTTRYLSAAPTTTSTATTANSGTNFDAVTGYPNFSGGSGSHTTKYLHHTHTAASAKTTGEALTSVIVLADE